MNILVIESKISAWKSVIEVIKEFVDEACFVAKDNGLLLRTFDKMSAALISVELPIGRFNVYQIEESVNIKVNISDLLKVIKCGNEKDNVRLSMTDESTLIVQIMGKSKSNFKVKCLDMTSEAIDIPEPYPNQVNMNGAEFTGIVKSLKGFGERVKITTGKECRFEAIEESAEFIISTNEYLDEPIEAILGTDYLLKVSKVVALSTGELLMGISEDVPCLFSVHLAGGGEVILYISQHE
jgi:proliferating cell nuclear antigen